MTENKTRETSASVTAFISAVSSEAQRADAIVLAAMMERLSGEPPRMWGPSIIGFGRYHYKYESGRQGESLRIGFSPRKGQTVLYVMGSFASRDALIARLGKIKTGKGCIYVKRLVDVDTAALEQLLQDSLAAMDEKYPREP